METLFEEQDDPCPGGVSCVSDVYSSWDKIILKTLQVRWKGSVILSRGNYYGD